ncbi:chemotaxis protein CheW [Virgibacillus sp. MG-45]|uniref:chemotaxis protein CheW n=1 Tax=Virgibacillus sp. MG-45 TaxID=3102791 RepID=UPI002ED8FAC1
METLRKIIIFTLNGQQFGVDVNQIVSIEKTGEVTSVPKTSTFIKGVMTLRGETTPIIDLKERLSLPITEETMENRILVVDVDTVQVGLIVDAATDVKDIANGAIEEPPQIVRGIDKEFLQGVAKVEETLILLLDLKQVLNLEETDEVKEITTE